MLDINEYIRKNYTNNTDLELAQALSITPKAVRERRRRMGLSKGDGVTGGPSFAAADLPDDVVSTEEESSPEEDTTLLKQLLDENGVSLKEVKSIKLSSWNPGKKDVKLGSASVTLSIDSNLTEGPAWPVIQQAAPVNFDRTRTKRTRSKFKTAVLFPDPQIGYRRDITTGELDPFHDEQAMAVALEVARDVQPDQIINMGDYLDFPMFGTFAKEPGFQLTVQPTIDRGHSFLCEQLEICEDNQLFEGNHDLRLQNWIMRNAMEAFGMKRANAPDEWPVMSVQHLLRLDELGVNYLDGYPNREYYINDRLRCIHGNKTAPRGKVASKIILDDNISTITGHIHRVESVHRTIDTADGPKVVLGMTIGSLCRTDGAVPSTNSAIDANARVIQSQEDWQQSVTVVEYVEGDGPFNITPIIIEKGEAIYQGTHYKV